jgi:hypothetical protein
MVISEVVSYLTGEAEAEETADKIIGKMEVYLSE